MQRRGIEGDQSDPLTVELGHIPQRLSGEITVVKIMLFLDQTIELGPFPIAEQAHGHTLHHLRLRGRNAQNHAVSLSTRVKKSSHFSSLPRLLMLFSFQMN